MIDIRQELIKLSDDKYRKFQAKIIPNIDNILGVQIPKIRKIAKKLNYDDKIYYINNYTPKYLEEVILKGLIICSLDKNINEILDYTEKYIPLIDNWCSCDIFCSSFHIVSNNKKEVFSFLEKYLNSKKEFDRRFALVILINYYICDEYIDELFIIINNIRCVKYYDKMALAWLISMIYLKYKDRTINYLKSCNLDIFTYNKSIQKIIESNKVSKGEREKLKKMKIKV